MSKLPLSWIKCQFGEVTTIVAGGTPNASEPRNFQIGGGVAWITPADLSGYRDKYISAGSRNLSELGYASCSAKKLPAGTVVFSSRAPIGYVAIAQNEISTNQGFKNFVLPAELDSNFVYYYLRHIKRYAENIATGTTFKELSGASAAKLPLVIAPFREQKRIAAKLDVALSQVHACRDRLSRVTLVLRRFRQSVLAAAFSGRLTEDWRLAHPLDTTKKLFEEVKGRRGGVGPSSDPRFSESLSPIPMQWRWTNLHFLSSQTEALCYGVVQPGSDDPNGVFLIRAGDLIDGSVDLSNLRRIPIEVDEEYRRSRLRGGELLITVVGAGIGECAIAPVNCAGFNIARALAKVPITDFFAEYVYFWLSSSTALNFMKADSREVARPTLNIEQLKTLPVPVPPLAEQEEIVRRVQTLFSLANRLEARVASAQNATEKLTPAILLKAFCGELVPQDPTDEPAHELFKRVVASRTSGANKPRLARKV